MHACIRRTNVCVYEYMTGGMFFLMYEYMTDEKECMYVWVDRMHACIGRTDVCMYEYMTGEKKMYVWIHDRSGKCMHVWGKKCMHLWWRLQVE